MVCFIECSTSVNRAMLIANLIMHTKESHSPTLSSNTEILSAACMNQIGALISYSAYG